MLMRDAPLGLFRRAVLHAKSWHVFASANRHHVLAADRVIAEYSSKSQYAGNRFQIAP